MTRLSALESIDAVLIPSSYLRYGARELPKWEAELERRDQPPFTRAEKIGMSALATGLELCRIGLFYYALAAPLLE